MINARPHDAAAVAVSGDAFASRPRLIIDAGHGGLDGGAVAADGTLESTLNLEIAARLRCIANIFGLEPLMTRTEESLAYPETCATTHEKKVWDQKQRVALINGTPNAVLVSIHQNNYPDKRPNGPVVLYAKTETSDSFAELTHGNLCTCLCPENRRVAAPISDKIYLTKNITCPAILVECGFLSNPAEAAKLKSGSYQTALASVIFASYLQYIS